MSKLTAQGNTVLTHLRTAPHLTSLEAEGVYRIRRLASRVDELRAAGYDVQKSMHKDATGQRYTRYSLSGPQRRAKGPLLPPRVKREEPVRALIECRADVRSFVADGLRRVYLNVYDDGVVQHVNRHTADEVACPERIACIEVRL